MRAMLALTRRQDLRHDEQLRLRLAVTDERRDELVIPRIAAVDLAAVIEFMEERRGFPLFGEFTLGFIGGGQRCG